MRFLLIALLCVLSYAQTEDVYERSFLSTPLTRDNYRSVFGLGEVLQTIELQYHGRTYISEETTLQDADFVIDDEGNVVSGEFTHGYTLESGEEVGALSYIFRDKDGRYVREIESDHSELEIDPSEMSDNKIDSSWWSQLLQSRRALSDTVEYSVKFYYDPRALEKVGGLEQLEYKLLLSAADANQAYANSGLNINVVIAGDLVEWTGNQITDENWRNEWVYKLSDDERKAGDVKCFIQHESKSCGVAFTIPRDDNYKASEAFFRIQTACLNNYVLAHEIGHLMGLGHNDHTTHCQYRTGCGHVLVCGNYYGGGNGRRTIMSQTSKTLWKNNGKDVQAGYKCTKEQQGDEKRIGYFSSPNVEYIMNGQSYKTGTARANSVGVIREKAMKYMPFYTNEDQTNIMGRKMTSLQDIFECTPSETEKAWQYSSNFASDCQKVGVGWKFCELKVAEVITNCPVTCAKALGLPCPTTKKNLGFSLVGNGWCLDSDGKRLNNPGVSWKKYKVNDDGSSDACARVCNADPTCVGYMTEDKKQCDVILSSDVNAQSGISKTDTETRVFCFQKEATPLFQTITTGSCSEDKMLTEDECKAVAADAGAEAPSTETDANYPPGCYQYNKGSFWYNKDLASSIACDGHVCHCRNVVRDCSAQLYEWTGTDMKSRGGPCPLYTSSDPNRWIDVCQDSDTVHISSGCSIEVENKDGNKFTFARSFAAHTEGVGYDSIRKIRLFRSNPSLGLMEKSESAVAQSRNDKLKQVNEALKGALEALAN